MRSQLSEQSLFSNFPFNASTAEEVFELVFVLVCLAVLRRPPRRDPPVHPRAGPDGHGPDRVPRPRRLRRLPQEVREHHLRAAPDRGLPRGGAGDEGAHQRDEDVGQYGLFFLAEAGASLNGGRCSCSSVVSTAGGGVIAVVVVGVVATIVIYFGLFDFFFRLLFSKTIYDGSLQ